MVVLENYYRSVGFSVGSGLRELGLEKRYGVVGIARFAVRRNAYKMKTVYDYMLVELVVRLLEIYRRAAFVKLVVAHDGDELRAFFKATFGDAQKRVVFEPEPLVGHVAHHYHGVELIVIGIAFGIAVRGLNSFSNRLASAEFE